MAEVNPLKKFTLQFLVLQYSAVLYTNTNVSDIYPVSIFWVQVKRVRMWSGIQGRL